MPIKLLALVKSGKKDKGEVSISGASLVQHIVMLNVKRTRLNEEEDIPPLLVLSSSITPNQHKEIAQGNILNEAAHTTKSYFNVQ